MISSNSLINKQERRFQSLALLTIVAIYVLVLAGGIVRGTGSGMGCPDWPKCFGRWIPPTEISQLPTNYQEIYGAKLKGEIEFNPIKTWIEYINRLFGVLSGFLVFATLLTSLSFWRKDKAIVLGSFAAFFLIGLNGWLGSKVVSTELAQYMITIHMLLAILVVFALLFVWVRSRASLLAVNITERKEAGLRWLALGLTLITIGQIVLGTEVREALDLVVKRLGYDQRQHWIANMDWRFYVHRSFSLVVLAGHLTLIFQLKKSGKFRSLKWIANGLLTCVLLEIGTGIVMAYLNVPAVAQPIHLLLAILLVGLQFIAVLALTPAMIFSRGVKRNIDVAHV